MNLLSLPIVGVSLCKRRGSLSGVASQKRKWVAIKMYSVLSTGGFITGYVVGSYYMPLEMARFFFDNVDGCKSVYGGRHGVFFVSNVTGEAVQVENVSVSNFEHFAVACHDDGVKLHNVLFVPCRYQDFDLHKTNGIWTVSGLHCYQCRYYGAVVGYIAFDRNIFEHKIASVAMIEMLQKREGFGTAVINELKSRGIHLTGVSVVDATEFWESVGAVFQSNQRFKL